MADHRTVAEAAEIIDGLAGWANYVPNAIELDENDKAELDELLQRAHKWMEAHAPSQT